MERLGDYRLRKRLAVGGMGEVYLGEKVGPEGFIKPVVLKCVLPQLANDRAFIQLFLDEARLAALLNHPNIAQVYDFGIVDGVYFIAMEYVPGYTVEDLRRKLCAIERHMPLQHVANIASQGCQGLFHAHTLTDARGEGLGLVHRDVSPHNIMVSIDGTVKLVDFGIAKARAGLTRVQAKGAVGKLGYMSPEQARGEHVDGRSDLYSLGVCLWELTTTQRLHDPKLERPPDYEAIEGLASLDAHRAEVPRQFAQIVERALAVDREQRAIREAIARSPQRDRIELVARTAASFIDLSRALLEQSFDILHIAGHGQLVGLVLDEGGARVVVPPAQLWELLDEYAHPRGRLRCVVLNSCWSTFASRPSTTVPTVISMDGPVYDHAAIFFAEGFYDAIGAGHDFAAGFREGRRRVQVMVGDGAFDASLFEIG
ncbi:MAG: protein kinase [Myxococcales bacterium]|nr:protein kinase [Myxococcales bacterium]